MTQPTVPEESSYQGKMSERVGFIGLGGMGTGMARNLQLLLRSNHKPAEADPTLYVFNRTKAKARELENDPDLRSKAVDSIADLASCSLVFCMLANDAVSTQSFTQYCEACQKQQSASSIYVDCSTILPSTTAHLVEYGQGCRVTFVACPVFGRPDAAVAARLLAVPAVPDASTKSKLLPYILSFAVRTIDLDGPAETANVFKLAGNFWIVSQIEVISECLTLAEKNGVPRSKFLELLEYMYSSPIPSGYASRIANDDFPTAGGFAVDLALKDVGHMRALAAASSCPVPLADTAFNHLLTAQAHGLGQHDWGAIAVAVRHAAGLKTDANAPPRR